jgi:hypothetical protein
LTKQTTTKGKILNYVSGVRGQKPTLTIQGHTICYINKTTNTTEKKFDWKNALIDAIITSAITFFSTLGGTAIAGHATITNALISAIIAASTQFFVFLALKRGLGMVHSHGHTH